MNATTITHQNPIQEVHIKGVVPPDEEEPKVEINGNPASLSTSVVHVRGKRASSNEKNADLKDPCSNPSTGMPVVIATGEKYKVETDFTAVNEYSFSLQRTYRSMFGSGTLFGANWMSNLDVPGLQWNKAQCQKFPNGDCVPVSVSFVDVTGAQTTYKLGPYEGGHEFYGTKHPFGSSVDAYLSSQLSERFVEAVVLPTTGAQEKTIAEAMIAYSKQGYALMSHNCATAVDSALTKAGAISNSSQSFLPGSNFQNLLGAPGAKYIYIPKGSLVPATFGAFNPGGR